MRVVISKFSDWLLVVVTNYLWFLFLQSKSFYFAFRVEVVSFSLQKIYISISITCPWISFYISFLCLQIFTNFLTFFIPVVLLVSLCFAFRGLDWLKLYFQSSRLPRWNFHYFYFLILMFTPYVLHKWLDSQWFRILPFFFQCISSWYFLPKDLSKCWWKMLESSKGTFVFYFCIPSCVFFQTFSI